MSTSRRTYLPNSLDIVYSSLNSCYIYRKRKDCALNCTAKSARHTGGSLSVYASEDPLSLKMKTVCVCECVCVCVCYGVRLRRTLVLLQSESNLIIAVENTGLTLPCRDVYRKVPTHPHTHIHTPTHPHTYTPTTYMQYFCAHKFLARHTTSAPPTTQPLTACACVLTNFLPTNEGTIGAERDSEKQYPILNNCVCTHTLHTAVYYTSCLEQIPHTCWD